MRRLLPALFCVAATTGLTACDQPVSGPTPDDEQELYDEVRKAAAPANPALADGDVALSRPSNGGGGDIIIFDIVDSVSRNAAGTAIQSLTDVSISAPDGQVLCTRDQSGGFVQLRDADGDVLLSSIGPFVFEGQPQLAGKTPAQQAAELASGLRMTFSFDVVIDGFANSGEEMVEASVPVQFSSNWRKLVIASLVEGYCGSDGMPQE